MPRHLNGFALAGLVVVAVALIVNQASAFLLPASTTTIPSTRSRPGALGQGAQRTVRTRGLASAQLQVRLGSMHQSHAPLSQPHAPAPLPFF